MMGYNEACGGMDNMCTVYDVNNRDASGTAKIVRELSGYEGFLSCSRFIDDNKLITGSGDMALTMWDLNDGKVSSIFGNFLPYPSPPLPSPLLSSPLLPSPPRAAKKTESTTYLAGSWEIPKHPGNESVGRWRICRFTAENPRNKQYFNCYFLDWSKIESVSNRFWIQVT